jgi:hypothetical protein
MVESHTSMPAHVNNSSSDQAPVHQRSSPSLMARNAVGSMKAKLAEAAAQNTEYEKDELPSSEELLRQELQLYEAKYRRSRERLATYKNDAVLKKLTSDLTNSENRNKLLQDEKLALMEKLRTHEEEQAKHQSLNDEDQGTLNRRLVDMMNRLDEQTKLQSQKDEEIEKLGRRLVEMISDLDGQSKQQAQNDAENEGLKKRLVDITTTLDEQTKQHSQKDEEIGTLEKRLVEMTSKLDEQKKLLDDRNSANSQLNLDIIALQSLVAQELSNVGALEREIAAAKKILATITQSDDKSKTSLFEICENVETLVKRTFERVRTVEIEYSQNKAIEQKVHEEREVRISDLEAEVLKLRSQAGLTSGDSMRKADSRRHDSKVNTIVTIETGERASSPMPATVAHKSFASTTSASSSSKYSKVVTPPTVPLPTIVASKETQPKPQGAPKETLYVRNLGTQIEPQVIIPPKTPTQTVTKKRSFVPRSVNQLSLARTGSPNAFAAVNMRAMRQVSPQVNNKPAIEDNKTINKIHSDDDNSTTVSACDTNNQGKTAALSEKHRPAKRDGVAKLPAAAQEIQRAPDVAVAALYSSTSPKDKQHSIQRPAQPRVVPSIFSTPTRPVRRPFLSESSDELSQSPPPTQKRKVDETIQAGAHTKKRRFTNTEKPSKSIPFKLSKSPTTTTKLQKVRPPAKPFSSSVSQQKPKQVRISRPRPIIIDDDDDDQSDGDEKDTSSEGSTIHVRPFRK